MNTLETVLKSGKEWKAGDKHRVYINNNVLIDLGFKVVDKPRYANEVSGCGKKDYYDAVKDCFLLESGSLKSAFISEGLKAARL
jgi:hypothetical protein